jgi:hypothetical protein
MNPQATAKPWRWVDTEGKLEAIKTWPAERGILIDVAPKPSHFHHVLLWQSRKERGTCKTRMNRHHVCTVDHPCPLPGSLANTTDVVKNHLFVEYNRKQEPMRASLTCMSTYFLKKRLWDVVTVTSFALDVKYVH